VREAIFSSAAGFVPGACVLDLFAGTGAMGIEALSRGADRAVFVDRSPECAALIRRNLTVTGFADRSEIITADAVRAARRLAADGRGFGVIFSDPPYQSGETERVLALIAETSVLSAGGVAILETAPGYVPAVPAGLTLVKSRDYNVAAVHYIQKGG
jgi:16S rRNA (guanine(966)-N(2))-methyltransferase RsmD